jgi:hypothetical protein
LHSQKEKIRLMDLHVTHDSAQGSTRRTARLRSATEGKDVEIFFDMEGVAVGPPAVLDGFVFGVIFYAMRLGEDLRVCGPMTHRAPLNLSEFSGGVDFLEAARLSQNKHHPG